jgi:hypothetical protein
MAVNFASSKERIGERKTKKLRSCDENKNTIPNNSISHSQLIQSNLSHFMKK